MRILVVDGDEKALQWFEMALGSRQFNVYGINSGDEAISLGKLYDYDAIVLSETDDVQIDTVIRTLRNAKVRTPILVVSGARGSVTNPHLHAIPKLDLGADDFVVKPCHAEELAARINALVRRSRGMDTPVLSVGPVQLNMRTKTCTIAGVPVRLTRKEYEILELMMLRKGVTLTKDAILTGLYGGLDEPDLKIVDVFVCKLRKKLTAAGAEGMIQTIWGRGYLVAA